jgi:hypothetical protein
MGSAGNGRCCCCPIGALGFNEVTGIFTTALAARPRDAAGRLLLACWGTGDIGGSTIDGRFGRSLTGTRDTLILPDELHGTID